MSQSMDRLLATHCAPALAGIKPACLVSCSHAAYPDLREQVAQYNRALNARGIHFEILCQSERVCLLLVYRKKQLQAELAQYAAQSILNKAGYPEQGDVRAMLDYLARRMTPGAGFPHEIGLFLGYPAEDVLGFQTHKGQHFKLCGHWKVYSDESKARALFRRYDQCRAAVCRRVERGTPITQLFAAV